MALIVLSAGRTYVYPTNQVNAEITISGTLRDELGGTLSNALINYKCNYGTTGGGLGLVQYSELITGSTYINTFSIDDMDAASNPTCYVKAEKEGYITTEKKSSITNNTGTNTNRVYSKVINVNMPYSLRINIEDSDGGLVTSGQLNITTSSRNITIYSNDFNDKKVLLAISASEDPVNITYVPSTYEFSGVNKVGIAVNSTNQTIINLTVPRTYETVFNLNDEYGKALTGATFSAESNTCVDNKCYLPKAGDTVIITKTGYNSKTHSVQENEVGKTISLVMQSTLKVTLTDDQSGAQVNNGYVQVNQTSGSLIGEYNVTNGAAYPPIDLSYGSVNVQYIGDRINYLNSTVQGVTLGSGTQTTLPVIVPKLYSTALVITNEDGESVASPSLTENNGYACVGLSCYYPKNLLYPDPGSITLKKDGYVDLLRAINSIEVGATIPVTMMRTLMINVYDDTLSHNLVAQGLIEVWGGGSLLSSIQSGFFSDGTAYAGISPSNSPVNISYIGNMIDYANASVNGVTITCGSPATVNLEVPKLHPVTVNALDCATPITGLTLNANPYYCANDICYLTDCGSPLVISKPGYLNLSLTVDPLDVQNSYVNASLDRNLRLNIMNDCGSPGPVTEGLIMVNDSLGSLITEIQSSDFSDMIEYLAIDPAKSPVTINYYGTLNYANEQIIISVNDSAQTTSDLIIQRAYPTTINAYDEESNPVINFLIQAVENCVNNVCYMPSCGSPINITKNGYVKTERVITPVEVGGIISVQVNRTLRLNFFDDNATPEAINEGLIQVNSSSGSLITTIYPADFNDMIEYLAIDPAQSPVTISYVGTSNQLSNSTTAVISDSGRANVTLTSLKVWPTEIDAINELGAPLSDYNLTSTQAVCSGKVCYLPRTGGSVEISKEGYVNKSINIPVGELGLTRVETLQSTVRVNVQDTNSTPLDGTLTASKQESLIASGSAANGAGYLPVNPSDNTESINITFSSDGYHDKTVTISPGSITDSSQLVVNLTAGKRVVFEVTAFDNFTQGLISDFETEVWNAGGTICSSVPCVLDLSIHPEKVNVTLTKPGYYSKTVDNASVLSNLTTNLSSTVIIHVYPDSDIKTVDTKSTVETSDDEVIINTRAVDGRASIPVPVGKRFYLIISEPGYVTYTTGNYLSRSIQTVIGSELEPIVLESTGIAAIDLLGPLITELSYTPAEPYSDDTINLTVKATDVYTGYSNIKACRMKVDSEFSRLMESSYDSPEVTAWITYSNLPYGQHTFIVQCTDERSNQWSQFHEVNITFKDAAPDEGDDVGVKQELIDELTKLIRIQVLEEQYRELTSVGYYNQEIESNIIKARQMIEAGDPNVVFIIDALEALFPKVTLETGEVAWATPAYNKQTVVYDVIKQENEPFTKDETVSLIQTRYSYEKSFSKITINGVVKTMVTLTVFSPESHPNWVVTELTNKGVEGSNVIQSPGQTIIYWKGITEGANVYSYVANGDADTSIEPIVFEVPELNDNERFIRSITGFASNLQQEPLALILIIAGLAGLIIVIKMLFF